MDQDQDQGQDKEDGGQNSLQHGPGKPRSSLSLRIIYTQHSVPISLTPRSPSFSGQKGESMPQDYKVRGDEDMEQLGAQALGCIVLVFIGMFAVGLIAASILMQR